ncbi:uncharacterized protein LOC110231115 [Arabidopsis lyrata subsp. lyrata]|uniref:uncharacterized protein LOC110231115 n=1 Tax=Arabidopsis lyrata subsp. lyrata TaxID=81972 RepID=UPI000A29B9FD|nr:uncharacterized protein LOC110231115 [Arabidopsis lyrata subsp. lyrata]|eukprot:XP_020891655.1 uncharacterized protein LOC110231115 [Arabidopsis lyrata subsp. lyrata]
MWKTWWPSCFFCINEGLGGEEVNITNSSIRVFILSFQLLLAKITFMSLLLGHPPKLCVRKPVLVRASPLLSNGISSSSVQTPPCNIIGAKQCEENVGKLIIANANERKWTYLDKKVPLDLVYNHPYNEMVTIGSSHGWVATLRYDGILRLQDDLNPVASDSDPKRISLPPLVTLPYCQTQIITNVSMSAPSPEEEDCVVAVKFLGPQLSFCRPAAQCNPEWINIRIANPCFFSSRVMFSKKDDMFCILGSGGDIIGSWDLRKHKHTPKLQKLQFQNLPELKNTTREVLSSCCCTSEHLVESRCTGETFLVKQYKKTAEIVFGIAKMKTEAVMVFKLDEEGNAVYTQDIGDLSIFLSKSEPFCVPSSSFPGMDRNKVYIFDVNEVGIFNLSKDRYFGGIFTPAFGAPYYIPPQKID